MVVGSQSIARQAALRLIFSLGLFVVIVGVSTTLLYRTAIDKAQVERADDLAGYYRARIDQLEHDWELQSRDFRVRIEYQRILERKREALTTELQAFLTIQGSERRFSYLLIQDKQGNGVFSFGKELALASSPLAPESVTGFHYAENGGVFRVFQEKIWLGEKSGMGRIAFFYRIDNALLFQLTSPGVTLTALRRGVPVASSAGQAGLTRREETPADEAQSRAIDWVGGQGDAGLQLRVRAPVKVLFSTAELAVGVSLIPILDALILWFALGGWLMRQARRINQLGNAVEEFSHHHSLSPRLTDCLADARLGPRDEIAHVAGELAEFARAAVQRDTERKREEAQRQLWAMVFSNSQEAILIADGDNRIVSVNEAFTRLTGYTADDVRGRNPSMLSARLEPPEFYRDMWRTLAETGHWQGEIQDRRKDGSVYPKWLSIVAVKDGDGAIANYIGIFDDISERKAAQERVEHLATHDVLTDLPNRVLLVDRMRSAIGHAKRNGGLVALLFLDLDRFKWVNDSLGHDMGDTLLNTVAERLRATVRASDTVARIGGDEFVILMPTAKSVSDIVILAEKTIRNVARPLLLGNSEFQVTTSVGVGIYPMDGADPETLLKNADTAMYVAKSSGRNQFMFFDEHMNTVATERAALAQELRQALARDEFELHYQPKVCLQTDSACGAEVLLRWNSPSRGLVSPMTFIPIAEETGLIVPLGQWVLQRACRQLRAWRDAGRPSNRLAINISALQLQQPGFIDLVAATLAETGVQAAELEFELTETCVLGDPERTLPILSKLRQSGIALALDDFGTGYSSLSYLRQLPVDVLKIDKSFVAGLPNSAGDAQIVKMIVALAKSSGLTVVAEGVELPEQHRFLKELGGNLVQGYLHAKPMPLAAYEAWLAARVSAACSLAQAACPVGYLRPA